VTLENIGLILAVTPRISPDGTVVMEIDAEKSNLGTEQDGIPVAVSTDGTIIRSPRIDTTTAQATVSAADGETIVLGGLITKNTQTAHRSVPYLNRIPLLKNLFRYDGLQTRRTELMIILTPRIIRNAEDNARIRQVETARMNWCAADVFDLHGEIGAVESISTDQLDAAEPQVIYPVDNPRGQVFGNGNRLEKLRDERFLGGRFRQNTEGRNTANLQSLPESFNR
jgi:Flp pilus assembly secretin CpaC